MDNNSWNLEIGGAILYNIIQNYYILFLLINVPRIGCLDNLNNIYFQIIKDSEKQYYMK